MFRRGGLIATAAALVGGALLVACSGGSGASGAPSATPASATIALVASPSGCSGASAGSSATLTPTVGGVPRKVIVHVPASAARGASLPLVLNLHGSGSTAAEQEAFSGMDKTADADGFIVAYPQGAIASGTGFDWHVPGQPLFGGSPVANAAPDDVAFITNTISMLEGRYCIDTHRVYATGFSGGARMTSQLACDLAGEIAAVAPVSGLRFPIHARARARCR